MTPPTGEYATVGVLSSYYLINFYNLQNYTVKLIYSILFITILLPTFSNIKVFQSYSFFLLFYLTFNAYNKSLIGT